MSAAEDSLQRATATVMRGPLDAFIPTRKDMERSLKQTGLDAEARAVAALRKPSLVLWALNQAGAVASDDMNALRAAALQVQAAQQRLLQGDREASSRMQRASQEQRDAIDTLTRRLGMVLTAAGHAASDETLRRIREGLRSASIAGEDTWNALQGGWLTYEPDPASFPMLAIDDMKRIERVRQDTDAQEHHRRVEAARAEVQRAEELERVAREQEETAAQRRREATEALQKARAALTQLQRHATPGT